MKKICTLLALVLITTVSFAQVGIGTKTPNPTSSLDLTASDKGFLPPRMTTDQRNAIVSAAQGLTIYNTTNGCLEFWNATNWISACSGVIVTTITTGPCAGQPVEISLRGLTYKPIAFNDGCWLDRNLGATKVATTINDPLAYGDAFQWGRFADGHEKLNAPIHSINTNTPPQPNSPTQTGAWNGKFIADDDFMSGGVVDWVKPSENTRWQGVNGVNNPCPTGFRLPTNPEFTAAMTAFSPNTADGAFASPLKLGATRFRFLDGVEAISDPGAYWTSTANFVSYTGPDLNEDSGYVTSTLFLGGTSNSISTFNNMQAVAVRCIKN